LTSVDVWTTLAISIPINVLEQPVARVQLALNVSDLTEAIAFYTKLFGVAPAKVLPGYANFVVTDPPLKLVLMEKPGTRASGVAGALNHVGVEMTTPEEVGDATRRLSAEGLETDAQHATTCCDAVQDKVWVEDPDRTPWEFYVVLADAPAVGPRDGDGTCCTPANLATASPGACC
jgi:catechol 2,3-dioxygenase-like lactoylglutathione lyase family enzyme